MIVTMTLSVSCLELPVDGQLIFVKYFPVPIDEYLLGVSDLTGELMRLAIAIISRKGGRKQAQKVCDFVRNCYAGTVLSY